MRIVGFVVLTALALALPLTAAPATAAAPEGLAGLWKAKSRFGPDARGELLIRQGTKGYTAQMVGRHLPVRQEGGEMAFDLPAGQGGFRGKLERGEILGHWFPPPSRALLAGYRYASPVRLKPNGVGRWRGVVTPFDDEFTFYLLLKARPDGGFDAVLRNPDRDYGAYLGVERLVREGETLRLVGKRAGQTELRDLAIGTYHPADDRLSIAFPNRGGTYDFRRDGDDSDFYPRGKRPSPYVYIEPPALDDGWPTGGLHAAGIDRAALERFIRMSVETPMDSIDAPQLHGVLIARHGKLVVEEYFHGEHRGRLHETRSASKSLTAVVVGAAIQAGSPLKLSSPVYKLANGGEFPADLEPRKRAMTLEHLMTMSSGYYCDDSDDAAPGNENVMADQTKEPDWLRYTLAVPMAADPGSSAVYCSVSANLALGLVGRVTGESPMYAFDRWVGAPMGINRYGWTLDPAGNPFGGGSVQMLPRDFMKLGQVMLDGGTWQGRRILGRDFVERAIAPHYDLWKMKYGYLWWGATYPYRGREVRAFFASGLGGQAVVAIPELDLVVAIYGANYSSKPNWRWHKELMPDYILPMIQETPGRAKALSATPPAPPAP